MRRMLTILTVVGALAGGGSAFASQTKTTAPATPAPAAKPAVHVASGKLTNFDSTTNMLTISTAKGEERFVMGTGVTFHEGKKAIAASDLAGLTGHRADVRYTESAGVKTAESVTVSTAAEKGAKTAPTSGVTKPNATAPESAPSKY